MSRPYLDTSAFTKWYVNEAGADEFASFMSGQQGAVISRLGIVEFRCLLARRRRSGELSVELEIETYRLFQDDIAFGVYDVRALLDDHAEVAGGLFDRLPEQPLRTLDALHLATALTTGSDVLATADRTMAAAGEALGLMVERF